MNHWSRQIPDKFDLDVAFVVDKVLLSVKEAIWPAD